MAAPEFLIRATESWMALYSHTKALSISITYLHFAGLLLGGGAAVAADRGAFKACGGSDADRAAFLATLASIHRVVVPGLVLMVVSGALMFLADVETYWASRAYWMKMALFVLLLVNGYVLRRAERRALASPAAGWRQLRFTAVASATLWFAIVLAGTILVATA